MIVVYTISVVMLAEVELMMYTEPFDGYVGVVKLGDEVIDPTIGVSGNVMEVGVEVVPLRLGTVVEKLLEVATVTGGVTGGVTPGAVAVSGGGTPGAVAVSGGGGGGAGVAGGGT